MGRGAATCWTRWWRSCRRRSRRWSMTSWPVGSRFWGDRTWGSRRGGPRAGACAEQVGPLDPGGKGGEGLAPEGQGGFEFRALGADLVCFGEDGAAGGAAARGRPQGGGGTAPPGWHARAQSLVTHDPGQARTTDAKGEAAQGLVRDAG